VPGNARTLDRASRRGGRCEEATDHAPKAESRKPKAESPKPIAEPAPNSPEDLGYSKTKGKKPLLKPEEREEVLRLSQIIAEAKRDTVRFAEAKKAAGEPLKEAKARLAKAIDQLDAVESGNWQPGMFTDGEVDGDGAGDENE